MGRWVIEEKLIKLNSTAVRVKKELSRLAPMWRWLTHTLATYLGSFFSTAITPSTTALNHRTHTEIYLWPITSFWHPWSPRFNHSVLIDVQLRPVFAVQPSLTPFVTFFHSVYQCWLSVIVRLKYFVFWLAWVDPSAAASTPDSFFCVGTWVNAGISGILGIEFKMPPTVTHRDQWYT